ncbi:MAG: MotA/TolQ/ExbB proton channel family protein, partial [Eubacteriales bacterium]|nr:MotA/TolQ/ExbB proton channel family protein [Eubacteriales bacterium]
SLLNRAVMKLERSAADGDRPIWREARFLGRAMRADWQRFLQNAGQLDLRGMPCSTQEYINEDTVIYKPGHAQLAELIPSLLTSLGILGTFMGLMSGLTSLDFTTAQGTIESIPTLLTGMRFAFATSVAGIACSLTFNITNRMAVGHAFKALDSFDEAFYELAMPRPLDSEVQLLCQKQDEEQNLQRVAQAVAAQVAGTLEMSVSRAVHPLTMSMDNFVQGATRGQLDGVNRIVGQFVQQMDRSLGGQLGELAGTLTRVNNSQLETQENLQRTLDSAKALAEEAGRIQEASRKIADRMDEDDQESELIALLKQSVERQEAFAQSVSQSQAALAESLQEMAQRLPAADDPKTHELSQEIAELTVSLGRMKQVVDELATRVEEENAHGKRKPRRFLGMEG